jgi:rod shape-determining protein MreD
MKTLKIALTIFLVYLLQATIVPRLAVFGVSADLFVIIITLFSVAYGAESGFLVGLFCGLVQDIFAGPFFFRSATKAILGFLMGTFKESVFGTEEGVALTAVAVATVTNFILEAVTLYFFFGRPLASLPALAAGLAISCLYNCLLAPLFYPLVKSASRAVME